MSGSIILMRWSYSNNDAVQKRAYSNGEKDEIEAWLDYMQPVILIL